MKSGSVSQTEEKDFNQAFSYCCRLLGSREYAPLQLRQKLLIRGYTIELVIRVLDTLKADGWLSEQRFCESFIRSRIGRGQGKRRIKIELRQWIENEDLIAEAFAEQEVDWQAHCNRALGKKVGFLSSSLELNQRLKLERFLQYRGFSPEQSKKAIAHLVQGRRLEH